MLGDRLANTTVHCSSNILAYASTYSSGEVNVTLVITSAASLNVDVKMKKIYGGNRYYWYSLEGINDNGEFSRKVLVNGIGPTGEAGGPTSYHTIKALSSVATNGLKVTIPARGAVFMTVDKKWRLT